MPVENIKTSQIEGGTDRRECNSWHHCRKLTYYISSHIYFEIICLYLDSEADGCSLIIYLIQSLFILFIYNEIFFNKNKGFEIFYQALLPFNFVPTVEVKVSQHLGDVWMRALQDCWFLCISQEPRAVAGQGFFSSGMTNSPRTST